MGEKMIKCPECKGEIYSSKWIICPHCGCSLGSDEDKICINIGEVEHVLMKHGIYNQVMPFVKALLDGAKNAEK
jgi:hypothetical protein